MSKNILNGVNVDQLIGTVDAVKQRPELARFRFRASNRWISGGNSVTKIQSFYGVCREDTSRTEFELIGDEPSVLLGSNLGPNAVEAILHAIASCLAVGISYNAAAMGIKIGGIDFELDGDIDLHGFLGLSEDIRPGYQEIRVCCIIEADAPKEKIEELLKYVQKTSPVLDMIRNPTPVSISLELI